MSESQHYQIVFSGEIAAGQDIGNVKKNIAALFKVPVTRCEYMFTGHLVTIREKVDYHTAEKYRKALKKAGAICSVEPSVEQFIEQRNSQQAIVTDDNPDELRDQVKAIEPQQEEPGLNSEKRRKDSIIEARAIRYFNRSEKIAILKLLIRIASADHTITGEEKTTIQEFLHISNLKISQDFWLKVLEEKYPDIVSVFTSKSNLKHAYSLIENYANYHGIHPEFEGKVLDDIKSAIEEKRKTIKFSLTQYIKAFFRTFTFLWGEEEVDFKIKKILAIIFTILACLFGSFWTDKNYWIIWIIGEGDGSFVMPPYSAVLGGLLIYGALSVRNYMPRPNSFQNILFVIADVYLLSIISMHILGRGGFERNIVIVIFFGLIVLLWLGMKELMGFFLIGIFIVIIYKIFAMEQHLSWRAFPFL